jgi:transforming growth factor-beta-induced protein
VIHVIDQVILPSSDNLVATADKAGTFKTLIAAAKAAGLVPVLTGDQPLTVFAPTDAAFAKLPAGTVESLLKPENKDKLAAILKFHVVPGRVYSNDILAKQELKTAQGGTLTAAVKDGAATINGAGLVATDIDASNGVIHVIDSVLLPPATPAKGAHIMPANPQHVSVQSAPQHGSYVCPQTGRFVSFEMATARRG